MTIVKKVRDHFFVIRDLHHVGFYLVSVRSDLVIRVQFISDSDYHI